MLFQVCWHIIWVAPEFKTTVKGLIPSQMVMNYTLVISLAFFVVAFLDWWFLKTSEISNKFFWYARSILSQVGVGVLSLLRIGQPHKIKIT